MLILHRFPSITWSWTWFWKCVDHASIWIYGWHKSLTYELIITYEINKHKVGSFDPFSTLWSQFCIHITLKQSQSKMLILKTFLQPLFKMIWFSFVCSKTIFQQISLPPLVWSKVFTVLFFVVEDLFLSYLGWTICYRTTISLYFKTKRSLIKRYCDVYIMDVYLYWG